MKLGSNTLNIEIGAYFVIWIGVVAFAGFKVKKVGDELLAQYGSEEFSDGWEILGGRKKDTSDFDWEITVYTVFHQILWLSIHLVVSELLRQRDYFSLLPYAQIAVTLSYLVFNFNILIVPIVLLQPLLFEVLSRFNRKLIVWQVEAICFVLLYVYKRCYYQRYFPFYIAHNDYTIIMLSLYWSNLRCVSYSMSKIDKTIKKSGFVVLLSYYLYLPVLTLGPFIDIHDFLRSHAASKLTLPKRLATCCISLSRFIFWWFVIEFLLHYVYSSYFSFYPKFVERFDSWTLCGYGYCMGQYFHMKYVVSYGISTTLAKFENIPAPDTPRCIGRIHLYSDMWRYFDNGLYVYLRSYIYVPLKKMKFPPYLASFCSFCFVYVWHGLAKDIMIWAFLNYICVTVESGFKSIYNKFLKKNCERVFSEGWRQRFTSMLAAPLLAVSAISNFYFFAGTEIGYIFFKNVFGGGMQPLYILLLSLYCCCQVSTYIKKREQLQFIASKLK